VGLGVVLRLTGAGHRRGAVGTALAGFGLLFLGIAMLQQSFAGLADRVVLPQGEGALAVLGQLSFGALLTVLMQSSSASMTIALTAAQGGLLTPQGAAAVVIGANIGTTVTALLAAVGATSNARRAAAAHVIFNVLTGMVALALLPWLIDGIGAMREAIELPASPAAELALFHTIFNVLGVLLMWPVSDALTRWLQRRFQAREDDEATPRHLDDTVLAVPALAINALSREVGRLGSVARRMVRHALRDESAAVLQRDAGIASLLEAAIERFVERVNRATMSGATSAQLAQVLRMQRYYAATAEQAILAAAVGTATAAVPLPLSARSAKDAFRLAAEGLLSELDAGGAAIGSLQQMEAAYQRVKADILSAGAEGGIAMAPMEDALRSLSALRRALQQAFKAAGVQPPAP